MLQPRLCAQASAKPDTRAFTLQALIQAPTLTSEVQSLGVNVPGEVAPLQKADAKVASSAGNAEIHSEARSEAPAVATATSLPGRPRNIPATLKVTIRWLPARLS